MERALAAHVPRITYSYTKYIHTKKEAKKLVKKERQQN